MKKIRLISLAAALIFTFSCFLDEDTPNSGGGVSSSSSSETYKTVKIGTQIWMAENLNYEAEYGKCYNNNPDNCIKYGRLYKWAAAMALADVCNTCYKPEICRQRYKPAICEWQESKLSPSDYCDSNSCQINNPHQGICPDGWHIPNDADWDKLFRFVDSENDGNGEDTKDFYQSETAGKYLKAAKYWSDSAENLDTYSFSALPGGTGTFLTVGEFGNIGNYGIYWSATLTGSDIATVSGMYSNEDYVYRFQSFTAEALHSVRCVRDD